MRNAAGTPQLLHIRVACYVSAMCVTKKTSIPHRQRRSDFRSANESMHAVTKP
jgi:hypothetical protein